MSPLSSAFVMSGSPVDWSEFHVWNFRIQDLEKLKQKQKRLDAAHSDTQQHSAGQNALSLAAASLASVTKYTKEQVHSKIISQWEAWNEAHASKEVEKHKQKAMTAKYMPAACGAIGRRFPVKFR
jgi:hypothetical protein